MDNDINEEIEDLPAPELPNDFDDELTEAGEDAKGSGLEGLTDPDLPPG